MNSFTVVKRECMDAQIKKQHKVPQREDLQKLVKNVSSVVAVLENVLKIKETHSTVILKRPALGSAKTSLNDVIDRLF